MRVRLPFFLSIYILFTVANGFSQNSIAKNQLLITETSDVEQNSEPINFEQEKSNSSSETLSFDCSTVFWTIDNSSNIRQWDLSGGQVTGGAVILQALNSMGLSFSNSAFYSASNNVLKKYTDASGWTTIPVPAPISVSNNGGYGNHQYFSYSFGIYHYDGNTFTRVATFDTSYDIQFSDIAVDSYGRAWVLEGTESLVANRISIYDANGLVTHYAIAPLNTNFGYGCFFINDVLYVAFGNSFTNPHANQIVPMLFNNGTLVAGTPIPFPYNGYHDLASCNSAANLDTASHTLPDNLVIFPNPAKDIVSILTTENIKGLEIFDVVGKKVATNHDEKQIEVSQLMSGIYSIKITTDNATITKRFIKE